MAVVGNNVAPNFGDQFYLLNVQNQTWTQFTMPTPGGWVYDINCFFDLGQSGPATAYVCIWGGTGGTHLLAYTTVTGIGNGSRTPGGQHWHGGLITSAIGGSGSGTIANGKLLYVPGGTVINIGANSSQANGLDYSFASSGNNGSGTQSSPVPGDIGSPASTGHGSIGAYADYNPNHRQVSRSGVWKEDPRLTWRSGAWIRQSGTGNWGRLVRRSGVWVQEQ